MTPKGREAPRILAAVLLVLGTGVATAPAETDHRVVIELFTSQGCSSCPPADRLLTALGREPGVLPLAFHIDSWNYLGWRDPFSAREWTERHVTYAERLGDSVPYTPQAVIDGSATLVGNELKQVREAIAVAAARPAAEVALRLAPAAGAVETTVAVTLPEELRDRRWDVMAAVYETGLVTPVGNGENGGQLLHNDYVVRLLRRAGRLAPGTAGAAPITVDLPLGKGWNRSNLGVAAFVQDPETLAIHGGAALPLAPPAGAGP